MEINLDVEMDCSGNEAEDEDSLPTEPEDLASDSDNSLFQSSKKGPTRPKMIKSLLTSFALFSGLPNEICFEIWNHTLKPRTVEIEFSPQHGFYSRVQTPVALRVCSGSRSAVIHLYPCCFGSILYSPITVFNFSLDTLYFASFMKLRVCPFLISMSATELGSIESIAIDHSIDEPFDYIDDGFLNQDQCFELFKKASHSMPALKEIIVVFDLGDNGDDWHGHGFPDGSGPTELFEKFTYELQQILYLEVIHMNDEDGKSECKRLPQPDIFTEGFDVPKTVSMFGWRPTGVFLVTPPLATPL